MYDICFKNNYITLAWDSENRLLILDSDGLYIDYVTKVESKRQRNSVSREYLKLFENKNEHETCKTVKVFARVLKIEPYCGDERTIRYLRNEWGDEWVVRIGNTAIILAE